jgi:hypothetical protein
MYSLTSLLIDCPYCGEQIEILADSSIAEQSYIEDCSVCCRPINLHLVSEGDHCRLVRALREDEC